MKSPSGTNRQCWNILFLLLLIVSFAVSVESVTLRGRQVEEMPSQTSLSRHLKEDKKKKDDETEAPTEATPAPTSEPTAGPSPEPTLIPSAMPSTSEPSLRPTTTASPSIYTTEMPTPSVAPVVMMPEDQRQLAPFSIQLDGEVSDQVGFQQELETYLLQSMRQTIPLVMNISLSLVPANMVNDTRFLQEETVLEYEGIAVLNVDDIFNTSPLPTTEEVQAVQVLALQDPDGLPAFFEESEAQPLIVSKVQVGDFEDVVFEQPKEEEIIVAEDTGMDDMVLIIGLASGIVVILALIGFFIWCRRSKPPPPPPYEFEFIEETPAHRGLVTPSKSTNAGKPDTPGTRSVHSNDSKSSKGSKGGQSVSSADESDVVTPLKPGQQYIDLSKPAQHKHGIDSKLTQEAEIDDTDSTFADARTIISNDESSMAGYSLATDGPDGSAPVDSQPTTARLGSLLSQAPNPTPESQNRALKRWFVQPAAKRAAMADGFISSNVEPHATLEGVPRPLPVSSGEIHAFQGNDEQYQSSYKEDDSVESGSVMSGISDVESNSGILGAPAQDQGALGYFHREDEEQYLDNYDVLPPRAQPIPRAGSDVPSDELNDDLEQDLTGFTKADLIQRGLDGIETPRRKNHTKGTNFPQIAASNSWENNPDEMARERRRIKRQTRNRREDRKQPPLTMEV